MREKGCSCIWTVRLPLRRMRDDSSLADMQVCSLCRGCCLPSCSHRCRSLPTDDNDSMWLSVEPMATCCLYSEASVSRLSSLKLSLLSDGSYRWSVRHPDSLLRFDGAYLCRMLVAVRADIDVRPSEVPPIVSLCGVFEEDAYLVCSATTCSMFLHSLFARALRWMQCPYCSAHVLRGAYDAFCALSVVDGRPKMSPRTCLMRLVGRSSMDATLPARGCSRIIRRDRSVWVFD
jgi:hypothetical protein